MKMITCEIPAGKFYGKKDALRCAKRELEEDTAYRYALVLSSVD